MYIHVQKTYLHVGLSSAIKNAKMLCCTTFTQRSASVCIDVVFRPVPVSGRWVWQKLPNPLGTWAPTAQRHVEG